MIDLSLEIELGQVYFKKLAPANPYNPPLEPEFGFFDSDDEFIREATADEINSYFNNLENERMSNRDPSVWAQW